MKPSTRITNRYDIIDKLGQGGMGVVWRVYDRLEQHEVALKQVLVPEKQLDFASKAGTDDTGKLRLKLAQEFSILATLRHPHILSVLDFGFDDDGHPLYTMTLLEGGQDVKSYATNISTGKRIKLLGQMLQALHYLHRRGVLHRDLKPDNVFVTTDEQVKVMDFGLAKLEKWQSTDSETIAGTINYIAPELFQGGKASAASDLFAVGVMVYEIMVGQHPFEANNIYQRVMNIVQAVPDLTPLPAEFAPWLETLLAKDPANRFATAYDAMMEFYDAVGVEPPAEDQAIRESFLQASTFVGREAELKQLTDALAKVQTENAFFLIGGESGVGKSRLLDELRVRALVDGATVLRGQAVEGGGLPFQLWRGITRRLLLMVEVTDLQAGVLKDIVPDVGQLLGRDITDAPELTGKAYQDRMMLTIVDLFRNISQPIVLLLEDIQWAIESLAVLEQILKIPEQLPHLIVVATYRDDEAPDLPEKFAEMTHITLERLTPDAVSELSSAILGDAGTNEAVVKLLHSQSEGNLFFLVETVRALAEASGDLQRIGDGKLPEGVLTGGMQAITRRRLSKVDPQYADIQTLSAVIGREIDTELLAYVHDDTTVQAWLSNASDYGVVAIQDNTWRFAHDKLRETLIADIPDDELPDIHRTAAESVEAVYTDDASYNDALLTHWQQVDDFDKTYHYALPVAQNMIEITGTYATAETLLQRLLDRLPLDDRRRIAPLNWLAESAWRQGNYNSGTNYATQAQQLATNHDDLLGLAISLHNLGVIARNQGAYERARDLNQQSLVIKQQLNDQRGIAISLNNLGIIANRQGDYGRASELHQQSLAIKQQLGDQRDIAISLNNLGVMAQAQGDYGRASELYQRSLAILQQLGDQRSIAGSLNNLGDNAYRQGDYRRASELYQQSLAIQQQLGDQSGISTILINLGLIAHNQGDYEQATDLFQQSLVIKQQLGDQSGISTILINLGIIAHNQGDYEEATDLFQQSLVIKQQLGDQSGIIISLNNLGRTSQKQGQSSLHWFRQSLAIAQEIQGVPVILENIVGFADYLVGQGSLERAASLAGLVQQHPAIHNDVSNYLDEVMPQLEAALSPDDLAAALERGKSLDLDTVVAELLAEFGGDEQDDSRLNGSDT